MASFYVPPPSVEEFVSAVQDFVHLIARLFKCKITVRADYAAGTFIVHESDHRRSN